MDAVSPHRHISNSLPDSLMTKRTQEFLYGFRIRYQQMQVFFFGHPQSHDAARNLPSKEGLPK
jgi:hypothetical protein